MSGFGGLGEGPEGPREADPPGGPGTPWAWAKKHKNTYVLEGPKPYTFIGFGDIYGPKPYKFIGFGDIYGPKPHKFIGFGDMQGPLEHSNLVGGLWPATGHQGRY